MQTLIPINRKRNNTVNQSMTLDVSRIDTNSSKNVDVDLPSIHKKNNPTFLDIEGVNVARSLSISSKN